MSEEAVKYELTGEVYDFSGEEPAGQPEYEHTGGEADFTDEPLEPPPVIGLRDVDGGFPNPVDLGLRIIGLPWRIWRGLFGQDDESAGH